MRAKFTSVVFLIALPLMTPPTEAAMFVDTGSEPFGVFRGVDFVRHTGRFVGATSNGDYRMAFEIIAPLYPDLGNGSVLVEPPHFTLGTTTIRPVAGAACCEDGILGRAFLFDRGFSYASVGFGTNGLNVLDPTATDLVLAGVTVQQVFPAPGAGQADQEILIQFVNALKTDSFATAVLGTIERTYGFGVSQTAGTGWQVVFHQPGGQNLLDFTLLFENLWRPAFESPALSELLPEQWAPISGIGKIIWVQTEADLLLSGAEQFRRAVVGPDADLQSYRLYEVAGAPHFPVPLPLNPLAAEGVARAMFLAGDHWVRSGVTPPPSTLLAEAPVGEIDPVYGFETGIARDDNLNALGGIRFPDVQLGRAFFVASLLGSQTVPGLPDFLGAWTDLQCEPLPDGSPRFANHGKYVSGVSMQANMLRRHGFLLASDAKELKAQAAESAVGRPGTCDQG
jgi:hypothetical protein